jgi:sarcosine oxidase subunit alpha
MLGLTEDPITFTWEGEEITARPGEPIAAALWRAGHVTQTRSLKYHRPRGPMCMTGDCPGCLVRVDGVPNVRGCTTPAEDGLEVESQTGWPSAKHDVFGVVDRLFERFDHERSFVRPQPVNHVYETIARRMAGFGTQPTGDVAVTEGRELSCDVLVAGGGPAGLAAARQAHEAGADVLLVDERLDGGSLSYHHEPISTDGHEADSGPELADELLDALPDAALVEGAVVGLYEEEPAAVLAEDPEGLAVHTVDAKATVIAVGGYEGPSIVQGNDVPGVLGARAARILLGRWDVEPGDPVAVVAPGRQGEAFADLAHERGLQVVRVEDPEWIEGDRRVEAVVADKQRHDVQAAVVDPGVCPSAELGRQAGVPYTWADELGGRVPLHRPEGTTPAPDTYVAGTCAGLHTLQGSLVQGRAAGRRAADEVPDSPGEAIEAHGGLEPAELEALRSVWNQ